MKLTKNVTRRCVLVCGMQIPAAAFVTLTAGGCGGSGSGGPAQVCVDPDVLSQGELSLRKSLQYVEVYEDPDQVCGKCTYFSQVENTPCGHCQIFNGPANPKGHCNSWSRRNA